MAFDADALVDRRRLKRKLAVWRVLAIVALVAVVAVAVGRMPVTLPGQSHVAVLHVDGLIVGDPRRDDAVRAVADDNSARALLVRIDSPGGTTYGSESLYRALRVVAEVKPVVAVMDGVAASGGYMTAIAADRIYARESTITGSIGVIMEATNFVGLMDMLGIESESIKSGPLKAEPNPLSRMTPEAREAAQGLVMEIYDMFVGMVAERRGMTLADARTLADGRVYTGISAARLGLIDGLGGDAEAREWLEQAHGIAASLPERDVSIEYPEELFDRLVSSFMGKSHIRERLSLDGLVSLWHPSVN